MKDFLGNNLKAGDKVLLHDRIDGCLTIRRVICQKADDKVVCSGYYNDVDCIETFNENELVKALKE
jgi:hypothetical protein